MLLLNGSAGFGSGNSMMSTSSISMDVKSAGKRAESISFTITITHNEIIPYEITGVSINTDDVLDFVVERKTRNIPAGLSFVTIPEVFETYAMTTEFSGTISCYEMSTTEITNAQYTQYLNEALISGDITSTSSSVWGGNWRVERRGVS